MPKSPANEVDEIIGSNIKAMRLLRGMSLEDVSASFQCPVSQQAYDKYESGKTRIAASTLVEIAGVFHCSVGELYTGIADLLPREAPGINKKLFKNFNQIESEDLQKAIANLVKAIVIELAEGFSK